MPESLLSGIRAVFFDAVGTVLFPRPTAAEVYADVARRHGYNISSQLIRTRFRAAFRLEEELDRAANWRTSEAREIERWRRIVAESLIELPDSTECFRELYEHFASPTAWELGRDAGYVLTALQSRGFIVGMGSNYDSRLSNVVVGMPELAPLHDRVVISSVVGVRKPAPSFFRDVIRVAGCQPHEILFVGDDIVNDCEGATAAGLKAVLLRVDTQPVCEFSCIRSLGELLAAAE